MFLHDIVSELTAEQVQKQAKQTIKENDDDLFAPSDRLQLIDQARKDPRWAIDYAQNTIRGRWPEAEPYIRRSPKWAVEYARYVIRGRWAEAEPVIMRYPERAYHYALWVIKGRWPEAEPRIRQNFWVAYLYAQYVIRGRWPEAEPVIMRDPEKAYEYAKNVIKGRWPEAEPYIMRDPGWEKVYKKLFKIRGKLKENDDDLFAADRKTADPWVTHYIGNPIVGYARIIPDLHSRWKYDPEDLHPEEQKFYHMAGERVPVMDWSERTHFAVIMIGAAHPLRVKTWMLDNVDIDLSLRQQDNDDDELAENDDDLFANSSRLLDEKLIMLVTMWAKANREDQLEIEDDINDEYGYAISRLDGLYVAAGDYHDIELYDEGTGSVLYFTDRNGIVEPSGNPAGDLNENDDDLFAPSKRLTNPILMARGIVQVADDFDDRADRMATWAAAESYRDDASILRFAARACSSGGLRACMKELMTIDDPDTWEYLEQTLAQDFDIDLSSLYDQYENGGLTESITESDDDLFADRGLSTINLPKLTTPSLENLFYAFSFETRPDYLPKTRMMMRKIAREFARRGRPLSDAVLQQYDLQDEQ